MTSGEGMVERVARALSGQDAAGWNGMPENNRELLYGGGKWHDDGRTRGDYREKARAAIEAMREPTRPMILATVWRETEACSDEAQDEEMKRNWSAMIDAALK